MSLRQTEGDRRLMTELLRAIAERKAMNLVVVGAGATGVELAAELIRSFDRFGLRDRDGALA